MLPSQPHPVGETVRVWLRLSSSSNWSYDKLQETSSQTYTWSILFYLLGSLAAFFKLLAFLLFLLTNGNGGTGWG